MSRMVVQVLAVGECAGGGRYIKFSVGDCVYKSHTTFGLVIIYHTNLMPARDVASLGPIPMTF